MRQCVHTARLVSAKTRTGSRGDPIQAPPAAALIPDNILGHLQMAATPTSACSSPPPATARVQGSPQLTEWHPHESSLLNWTTGRSHCLSIVISHFPPPQWQCQVPMTSSGEPCLAPPPFRPKNLTSNSLGSFSPAAYQKAAWHRG